MISQKSHSIKLFLWKHIFVIGAGFCAVFLGLSFNTNEASALFVPTLSASIDQASLQVNGNQVINSTDKTTEIPFNFTVNTNNRTGYTATLSSETDNTALTNASSAVGAKIDSINTNLTLNNLPNNTWGYKFGASTNYAPIPALSSPAQIIQTTGKTNGNESSQLNIGMKLSDNLESGRYQNKLILSFVSNPYQMYAVMTNGPDFNTKLEALETATNKIKHFKKSPIPPATTANAKNIENEDSDYEIKLWLDPADKTAYYYTEPEKVYLNKDSSRMFLNISDANSLDPSHFDTSRVTNMSYMFAYSGINSLNLSNFDTSKVTNMRSMFNEMYRLTSINLSSFDTSQVTDMTFVFSSVYYLKFLDLSNFDTSKVTNMTGMFHDMTYLTSLDISNFDTSNVEYMGDMFGLHDAAAGLDRLEKIYVNNDFNTSKLRNFTDMFEYRKKLRGGAGSFLADPSTADKSWLRIDDPAHGRPGYFTRKT